MSIILIHAGPIVFEGWLSWATYLLGGTLIVAGWVEMLTT